MPSCIIKKGIQRQHLYIYISLTKMTNNIKINKLNINNNTKADTMHKKVRQMRTIKNGIVPVDDITIDPGNNFIHWIQPTRDKLSKRESILLQKRIKIIHQIIELSLTQFKTENLSNFQQYNNIQIDTMHSINTRLFNEYFVNGDKATNIRLKTEKAITKQLEKWRGVQRSKKVVKAFRDYFKISKNWFDQKKIEIIADNFYLPIIKLMYQVQTICYK